MSKGTIPAYITSLIRHFEDLRDGTHGGSASRKDKEAHFEKAVQLLAPIAPGSHRNEHELAARHRAAHGPGTRPRVPLPCRDTLDRVPSWSVLVCR
jgi:hypothetical protein